MALLLSTHCVVPTCCGAALPRRPRLCRLKVGVRKSVDTTLLIPELGPTLITLTRIRLTTVVFRSNLGAALMRVGGRGMPECIAAEVLDHCGLALGRFYCPLENRFVCRMRIRLSYSKLSWREFLCVYRQSFAPSGKGD